MNIIRVFQDEEINKDVVITGTYSNPLFKANDIAEILGLTNVRSVLSHFDSSKKITQNYQTSRGIQQMVFLTKKGVNKLLMKSRKHLTEKLQDWFSDILEEFELMDREQLIEQLDEAQIHIKTLEKEIEEKHDTRHYIYIFDTKTSQQNNKSILKIGVSENTHQRAKPYKTLNPKGEMVFRIECPADNVRVTEKWIHCLLKQFRQAGEVFEMNLELAKKWVAHVGNTIKLSQCSDIDELESKLTKIIEFENAILNQNYGFNRTKECDTQTEDEYFRQTETTPYNEMTTKFDSYVEECCVFGTFFEVSAKDIEGQFRLWARSVDKETFHALKDYLQTRFKYVRLPLSVNANNVVYGYRGLKLKEIPPFTLSCPPSDHEVFLMHACIFSPSAKVIMNNLLNEYEKWGVSIDKSINTKDLKDYLKNSSRILVSNVWNGNENGQGYYGLGMKKDEIINQTTSSTGKKVTKRSTNGDVVATWTTIAKAAQDEGLPTAKLSRVIKNETIINGFRYTSS
jgi:prophage antirepressor-like protein